MPGASTRNARKVTSAVGNIFDASTTPSAVADSQILIHRRQGPSKEFLCLMTTLTLILTLGPSRRLPGPYQPSLASHDVYKETMYVIQSLNKPQITR